MHIQPNPPYRTLTAIVFASISVGIIGVILVTKTIFENIKIVLCNHFKREMIFRKPSELNLHLYVNQHMSVFIAVTSLCFAALLIAASALDHHRED